MYGVCRAQVHPATIQNRRLCLSPIDAVIYLVVGGRLCRQIPIRFDVRRVIHLRITAIPQRRPADRGYGSANGWFEVGKSEISATASNLMPTLPGAEVAALLNAVWILRSGRRLVTVDGP